MPEEGNTNTGANPQDAAGQNQGGNPTPDAAANNTDAGNMPGSDTQAGKSTEGTQPKEKTFTQADVDRIVGGRLKKAVKAELKKLTGENDDNPTVEELQRQLNETRMQNRTLGARDAVRDYLSDPANKLGVSPENFKAIEKLVMPDLQFDDEGKPTNLKDAVETARKIAPALFVNGQASINAGAGKGNPVNGFDMNAQIRRAAGRE